jgi:hypothetical protein
MWKLDTPALRAHYRWYYRLKVVRCASVNCNTEFKQNSLAHRFCEQCAKQRGEQPWQPKVKAIIDEFVKFCEKHGIPQRFIVDSETWQLTVVRQGQYNVTDAKRATFAKKLAFVMDRFRRGYYVLRKEGAVFQNPPWQPYCPVDHTYCRGAILPGDCPRRHPQCAYSKNDWFAILEIRGEYEIGLDKNHARVFSWGIRRPLIGRGHQRGVQPDARAIRQHASALGDSQKPTAADGHGV